MHMLVVESVTESTMFFCLETGYLMVCMNSAWQQVDVAPKSGKLGAGGSAVPGAVLTLDMLTWGMRMPVRARAGMLINSV